MAAWFVNSVDGVGGTGAGTSWANAALTLTAGFALAAAGDTIWVGSNHAESTAGSITLTSPGTVTNPCFIYCVNHLQASPGAGDLATTATISTTGASNLTIAGSAYFYGITFNAGSGAVNQKILASTTTNAFMMFEACSLRKLGTTGVAAAITFFSNAAGAALLRLKNTTLQFGSTSDTASCQVGGNLLWENTASAILGSLPTTLFSAASGNQLIFEGVDFSALGSGKTLVGAAANAMVYLKDCALGASVTVASAPTNEGANVFLIRSDSAATNYRSEKYTYTGTETTETSITRVGGATDGTTPQSRKYVTTANSKWVLPFQGLPLRIWNPFSSGSHTIQVFGTINAGAVPNNDDFWCDLEYLGSSLTPLGSFTSGTKANNLATGSPLTVDTSTWNGGGSGGGWSPFSQTLTFSPQQAGYIYIYPKAAKASTTYYLDPTPLLS